MNVRSQLDWSQCPLMESDPEKVSGAWVFKDTRMPVATVFACLANNSTLVDILESYGGITPEQIKGVLKFVADNLETSVVHTNSV